MTHHRSRVCHFVIDCDDLDRAVAFWSAALDATEEPLSEQSHHIYRRLRLVTAARGRTRTAASFQPGSR